MAQKPEFKTGKIGKCDFCGAKGKEGADFKWKFLVFPIWITVCQDCLQKAFEQVKGLLKIK